MEDLVHFSHLVTHEVGENAQYLGNLLQSLTKETTTASPPHLLVTQEEQGQDLFEVLKEMHFFII